MFDCFHVIEKPALFSALSNDSVVDEGAVSSCPISRNHENLVRTHLEIASRPSISIIHIVCCTKDASEGTFGRRSLAEAASTPESLPLVFSSMAKGPPGRLIPSRYVYPVISLHLRPSFGYTYTALKFLVVFLDSTMSVGIFKESARVSHEVGICTWVATLPFFQDTRNYNNLAKI
ncbi:hypothetical protein BGZ60DRAFT_87801 [Tricladium varicosporioides]|nr:hypothetical protein BGZ60DRAFT_87801 [Hymenoscyphus varicosporioides]